MNNEQIVILTDLSIAQIKRPYILWTFVGPIGQLSIQQHPAAPAVRYVARRRRTCSGTAIALGLGALFNLNSNIGHVHYLCVCSY